MTSGSFISSSTYRYHNLQLIAVFDRGYLMQALGHDLAIALDGDLLSGHLEVLEKVAHVDGMVKAVRLAVYGHLDHTRMILEPLAALLLEALEVRHVAVFAFDRAPMARQRTRAPPEPRPDDEAASQQDREHDGGEDQYRQ